METFACLPKINMLVLVVLPFFIVSNLTIVFDPCDAACLFPSDPCNVTLKFDVFIDHCFLTCILDEEVSMKTSTNLSKGTKRSPWTLLHVCPRSTCYTVSFPFDVV